MNEFAKWRLVCIIISAWKLKHVPIIFNFILIKCFSSFSTVRYFLNYIPLRICIETTTPQGKEFTAVQKEIIIWYNLRDNTSTKQRLFELHNSGMTIMNNRTVQNLFEKGARERKKTKNEMEVKKPTTPRDDRGGWKKKRQALKDLRHRYNTRTVCDVSRRTERLRLCSGGYNGCIVSKRITTCRVNWERRVRFCWDKSVQTHLQDLEVNNNKV